MISLNGKVKAGEIEAWHIKDKIFDKKEADKVMDKIKLSIFPKQQQIT